MIDLKGLFETVFAKGRQLELAEATPKVELKDVEGHLYVVTKSGLVPHVPGDFPTVTVHTLAGLAHYVQKDVDHTSQIMVTEDEKDDAPYVLIRSFDHVVLQSGSIATEHGRRHDYCEACAIIPSSFSYGSYLDAESFIVGLLSKFQPTEDRDKILRLIGTMTSGTLRTADDDGITQQVTVKAGVTLKGQVEVKNPVVLKPYRTFHDIDQPASNFVLRFRQDGENKPQAALYEADGGQWKVDAMRAIHARLTELLPPTTIILS